MENLTKRVSATIPGELWELFDKQRRKYKKSTQQAITELIAAWTGRPDLTGSHRSTSPVIERATTKADIAIEQIRNGTSKGWKNLIEAVNDLIFHNQMAVTQRIIKQAITVTEAIHGENHSTTKDIRMLEELWDARSASLEWDNASTWQPGSPPSVGYFLVLSKGSTRLSHVSDREHPDVGNEEIQYHLRIQSPPKGFVKKDRVKVDHQEQLDQPQLSRDQAPVVFLKSPRNGSSNSRQEDPSPSRSLEIQKPSPPSLRVENQVGPSP